MTGNGKHPTYKNGDDWGLTPTPDFASPPAFLQAEHMPHMPHGRDAEYIHSFDVRET